MILEFQERVGLPFTGVGRDDCLETVRWFYDKNFGIKIKNYARPHDWKSNDLDLIRLCYAAEGFDTITDWKVADLRPADLLAVMIGESNPNHLAVYLGEGEILHHLYGQFSRVDPWRDFWRNQTAFILRHPDVPDLRPVYPDTDIGTIVRERNSQIG